MTSVMCLHSSVPEEGICNGKCHFQYTLVNLQTIMYHKHAPRNTMEHIACRDISKCSLNVNFVSCGRDTNDEVVDYWCNLGYASSK
jgi:hypothetical protein